MTVVERALSQQVQHYRVLSLDVFDTVLTRACGAPHALYLWLGRRLFQRGIIKTNPEVFARARARAEREVWYREGGMDSSVGVADFYQEVTRILWLDRKLISELVAAELELEQQTLRPTPQAARLIGAAQEYGTRVVFTSDTYFPADFIRRSLQQYQLWPSDARCIASIDYQRSKATGTLFQTLLDSLQVSSSSVIHAGDNQHSDVNTPRAFGIKGCWLGDGRLNRYEQLLNAAEWATSGMSSALAGASRMARLTITAKTHYEAALRDVAAGVAAPILMGYALWLLHRAQDLGLSRLYFIARDGQVLADIAHTIVTRMGWPIEIRYFYASRQTTNLAATFEGNDEELAWVFRDRKTLSPEALLARLDIEWRELAAHIDDPRLDRTASSTSDVATTLVKGALRSEAGHALLLERAAARRELVNAYLQQEGLLDDVGCGLVDFGGIGSQMRALHELIVRAGAAAPRLFLMGLDSLEDARLPDPVETGQWLKQTECYLYDHRRKRGIRRRRGFGTCVQMFCAADHGTVTGYVRQGSRIEPLLLREVDHSLIAWGLPLLRMSLSEVMHQIVLDNELIDLRADLREISCQLIELFWSEPTTAEAVAWGAYPFVGAEAVDAAAKPLAYRYSWYHILHQTVTGVFPKLGWQHWFEGSVRQSGPVLRFALTSLYRGYRRMAQSRISRANKASRLLRRLLGRG